MSEIIIYSTGCPRCNVLKTKLDSKNITYKEVTDVDEMVALGIDEVPMVRIGDALVNFTKAVEWINSQGDN